jgi:putative Mg2+ transporter-C (MgtC) family protein
MSEPALRALVSEHGLDLHNLSYRLRGELGQFEYRMVLRTLDTANLRRLSETLSSKPEVFEYRIAPASE